MLVCLGDEELGEFAGPEVVVEVGGVDDLAGLGGWLVCGC